MNTSRGTLGVLRKRSKASGVAKVCHSACVYVARYTSALINFAAFRSKPFASRLKVRWYVLTAAGAPKPLL